MSEPREESILRLAENGTKGPWVWSGDSVYSRSNNGVDDDKRIASTHFGPDRDLIAACDPQTIANAMRVIQAAQKRIGGSHAMGCLAYGSVTPGPCDCGRDELKAALRVWNGEDAT